MKGNYGTNRYVGVCRKRKGRVGSFVPPGCECRRECGKKYVTASKDLEPFPGCTAIEDDLLAEGLILYEDGYRLTLYEAFFDEMREDDEIKPLLSGEYTKAEKFQNSGIVGYVPEFDCDKSLKDLVSEECEDKESSKKFEHFLSSLTEKQREAITSYFIENEDDSSQEQVAEKLGVKIDAFKDRLKYAKKKLFKAYPELKPVKRSEQVSLWRRELLYGGHCRRSENEKLRPVTYLNYKTGARKTLTVKRGEKPFPRSTHPFKRRWLRHQIEFYKPQFELISHSGRVNEESIFVHIELFDTKIK